jgi:hypothetical protein
MGHHLLVREAQDIESLRREEGIARSIRALPFLKIVRLAIKLDDQFDRQASKVGDVVPKWDLPAKTDPVDSIGLQVTPQQRFSARHRPAKSLRAITLTFADGCVRHL